MTVERRQHEGLLREIVAMLREVTGEDEVWASQINTATRLDDDLMLESVELAELDELLRNRYGNGVNLLAFLAERDLDEVIALTVGDLVRWVAER